MSVARLVIEHERDRLVDPRIADHVVVVEDDDQSLRLRGEVVHERGQHHVGEAGGPREIHERLLPGARNDRPDRRDHALQESHRVVVAPIERQPRERSRRLRRRVPFGEQSRLPRADWRLDEGQLRLGGAGEQLDEPSPRHQASPDAGNLDLRRCEDRARRRSYGGGRLGNDADALLTRGTCRPYRRPGPRAGRRTVVTARRCAGRRSRARSPARSRRRTPCGGRHRSRPPRAPRSTNGGATSSAGSVTAALPQTAAPWAAVAFAAGMPVAPSTPRTTPQPVP